jgi:hypothetical protein
MNDAFQKQTVLLVDDAPANILIVNSILTHNFTSSVGCRDTYKLLSSKGCRGDHLWVGETSKSLDWRVQMLPRGQPH